MTRVRVTGFVVGSDMQSGIVGAHKLWKVRVKDETNEHDGKKFVVASIEGDITLAPGLSVTFVLGSFPKRNPSSKIQGTELRAVDVRLDGPQPEGKEKVQVRCDHCSAPAEVLFEAVNTANDSGHYARTCLTHLQQTVMSLRSCVPSGQRCLQFVNVFKQDTVWRRWPEGNFEEAR